MSDVTRAYNNAKVIEYDENAKFVLMSDIHRGIGTKNDEFKNNKDLFVSSLKRYYNNGFTYIELGDGDELWEHRDMSLIIKRYLDVFLVFKKFLKKDRLHLLYGNHDMEKRSTKFAEQHFYSYYDEKKNKTRKLFKGIKIQEAIILKRKLCGGEIFLLHGHQVDILNNRFWRFARFLVRYLWMPLQHLGIKDPTRTAQVYEKKKTVERKLTEWIIEHKVMMITGHTHKPMFSDFDTPAYFNDGSCVSEEAITAIEIESDNIILVKWYYKINKKGNKILMRETMAGPAKISEYFDYLKNS